LGVKRDWDGLKRELFAGFDHEMDEVIVIRPITKVRGWMGVL
jgi:hypothetical protein